MGFRDRLYSTVSSRQKRIAGGVVIAIWSAAGIAAGPGNFWAFMAFSTIFVVAAVVLALTGSHSSGSSDAG
jgi:hypothetical protein